MDLTGDTIRHILSVADYDKSAGFLRWKATGKRVGYYDKKGYRRFELSGVDYSEHRVIFAIEHGSLPNHLMIDHVNRNKRDNKIENLRIVTNAQNQRNRGPNSGRKLKGVHKARNRWKAEITVDGARKYLGVFDLPEDAARAYNIAAAALHGEHARLNRL